jgi:hypothetical protein
MMHEGVICPRDGLVDHRPPVANRTERHANKRRTAVFSATDEEKRLGGLSVELAAIVIGVHVVATVFGVTTRARRLVAHAHGLHK